MVFLCETVIHHLCERRPPVRKKTSASGRPQKWTPPKELCQRPCQAWAGRYIHHFVHGFSGDMPCWLVVWIMIFIFPNSYSTSNIIARLASGRCRAGSALVAFVLGGVLGLAGAATERKDWRQGRDFHGDFSWDYYGLYMDYIL